MLARFPRHEFLTRRWHWQPGEQVFIVQPTQGGKTFWAWQLMMATPHARPPVALVMKPRDPTPAEMTARYGWKEVRTWPPQRRPWEAEPAGYTLWPRHSLSLDPGSLEQTNLNIAAQFNRALMDTYRRGDRVVFVDEIHGLLDELRMRDTVSALSNRGSGMNASMWYATQRPAGTIGAPMPGYLFSNPTHLFLGYDKVVSNRKRFADIGGADPQLIMDEVSALKVVPTQTNHGVKPISPMLYLNKNGGHMCIVEPW